MGIDPNLYNAIATKGDVAGAAISSSIALINVALILQSIKDVKPLSQDNIDLIQKHAVELSKLFNELTGWENER